MKSFVVALVVTWGELNLLFVYYNWVFSETCTQKMLSFLYSTTKKFVARFRVLYLPVEA